MNKEQLQIVQYLVKYVELAQSRGAYQIPESAELHGILIAAQKSLILKEEDKKDE